MFLVLFAFLPNTAKLRTLLLLLTVKVGIEYKARLHGVKITYIDPHSTSKNCSRCGLTSKFHSKFFECPHCGHVDHADVNASFNIALKKNGIGQFTAERDAVKGSTDTPRMALARNLKRIRKANHKTYMQLCMGSMSVLR